VYQQEQGCGGLSIFAHEAILMNLHGIVTSAPIDKEAALVTNPGEQYIPKGKLQGHHWKVCPPLRNIPRVAHNSPFFENLKGKRVGRFTVLGLWEVTKLKDSKYKRKAIWICKCDCGDFEGRTSRALKNPDNSEDRCWYCRQLLMIKRKMEWQEYGTRNQG
jgi:hypothetical protein